MKIRPVGGGRQKQTEDSDG